MSTLHRVAPFAVIACVIMVCAMMGFYALFSNFRAYDDEGLLMLSTALYLEGHKFYSDIPWLYGPFYLAVVEFLHAGLGISISHSAVRYVTLFNWAFMAGAAGLLVARLASSRLWGLVAFILAFLYVESIVNEPGHPQVLVATGTIMLPLLASVFSRERGRWLWLLLGVTCGLVLQIKLNAGIFLVAASLVVLLAHRSGAAWRGMVRAALVLGSLLFPLVLMWPLLSEPDCLRFAILAGICAATVGATIESRGDTLACSFAPMAAFATGILVATILALAYAGYHGASAFDIVQSLLSYRAAQNQYYHFFREYTSLQLVLACISLAMAFVLTWSYRSGSNSWLGWTARTALTVTAFYALAIDGPANSQAMFGYAAPWVWVIVLCSGKDVRRLGRMLLAATAVWSPLLAYPIPGSQMYFGSLPILLAALVNLADIHRQLRDKYTRRGGADWLLPVPWLVLCGVLILLAGETLAVRAQYRGFAPLALPGTADMRIEPHRAKVFRQLVEAVNTSDVVLTTFRFNSLYFWSEATAPVPAYLAHAPLAYSGEKEQLALQQALALAQAPQIVTRVPLGDLQPESGLIEWIDDNFEPYRKIGGYTLLKKMSDNASPEAQ